LEVFVSTAGFGQQNRRLSKGKLRRMALKKLSLCLVVALLLGLATQSLAADYYVESRGDTVIVHVKSGMTGITVVEDIELNADFLKWIALANAGEAYFNVIVSNDDTKWAELQILERDPKFKPVDFDELNLNYDTLAKGGRETAADIILTKAGLSPEAQINWRFTRDKTCYFKIYGVMKPKVKSAVQPAPTIDTGALLGEVNRRMDELSAAAAKTWSLGLYGGLGSTRHTIAPIAAAAIYYHQKIMLGGHGVHSLFLRQDRDYFGSDEPTFERGWGVAAGYKVADPFWLSLGWTSEENILDAGEEAGDNLSWYDAGELGLSYRQKNLALQLGLTYGHEKDYADELTTNFGVRFAVMVGNTWGW